MNQTTFLSTTKSITVNQQQLFDDRSYYCVQIYPQYDMSAPEEGKAQGNKGDSGGDDEHNF